MLPPWLASVGMLTSTARIHRDKTRRRPGARKRRCSVEALEPRLALNGAASVVAAADIARRPAALLRVDGRSPGAHAADRAHHRVPAAQGAALVALPPKQDLRSVFANSRIIPYNQLNIGSCTANTVGAAITYQLLTDSSMSGLLASGFAPSRLFGYYNARFLGGFNVGSDSGAFVRDALKSAEVQGVASEGPPSSTSNGATWPYSLLKTLHKVNPGTPNYIAARELRVTGFTKLGDGLDAIKSALANRQPVAIAIRVYENFSRFKKRPADAGADWLPTIPIPEGKDRGGHAVLLVGYDDTRQAFIVLNSWGEGWGGNGYAYLPYAYVRNPKWSNPHRRFTIQGVATDAAPATIGGLDDLTARNQLDKARGLVHIDTSSAAAPGTATSFDFYEEDSPGRSVTPLLFSYNAGTSTYRLTGIGRSYVAKSTGEQGVPFDPIAGSAAVGRDSVFGFADGQVVVSQQGMKVEANAGVVPFNTGTAASPPTWLTSRESRLPALKIGATFSSTGRAAVKLRPLAQATAYSAMLVE
jgi:hypothetical protein